MEKRMKKLRVSEIFYSIQGEGANVGIPMIFIRLWGCNLNCWFCDSKYAWQPIKGRSSKNKPYILMDEYDIITKVKSLSIKGKEKLSWVCLTGGEPLIQDISKLTIELKEEGYLVAVETNGTILKDIIWVDWVAVSPKIVKIRGRYKLIGERILETDLWDEAKIVIWDVGSIEWIIKRLEWCKGKKVFLQAVDNDIFLMKAIVEKIKENPQFRLGYQIQKFIWGSKRGV